MDKFFKKVLSYKLILIAIFVVYISTFINIPISNSGIPITGQSLAVLLVSFLLPRNEGVIAVFLYVVLGAIGLPIFADGLSGIEVIRGKSGGYIYGFIAASWVVLQFREVVKKQNFKNVLIGMLLGTAIILVFGVVHLTLQIGRAQALEHGLYPYLFGAAIKIVLGTLIVMGTKRLRP